jgi:hypothetical protein
LYEDVDEFTFHQSSRHVNHKLILLHNQSTTEIFCNSALLANIRDAGKIINIHCNAGTIHVSMIGMLRNYVYAWLSKNAIVNIMLLSQLKEHYPVKYDSSAGNHFMVEQPTKKVIFKQSKSGL